MAGLLTDRCKYRKNYTAMQIAGFNGITLLLGIEFKFNKTIPSVN